MFIASLPVAYTEPMVVLSGAICFAIGMGTSAVINYEDPHKRSTPLTTWGKED